MVNFTHASLTFLKKHTSQRKEITMSEEDWGLLKPTNEGVGTSDKPKDKKPDNAKSRKSVRK